MNKTITEINEKIRKGQAVVVNAEEIIGIVEKKGIEKAAREIDVVTTTEQTAIPERRSRLLSGWRI